MKISEFAINRPVTTTMAVLSMLVLGLLSVSRIPLIFLPDVSRPFLRVYVPYSGSNPEEVERLITRPVEEIMGTVPGVKMISSNSSSDGCSVRLEFDEGRDMDIISMEVRDRLDRIRPQLPDDMLDQPRVMRWSTTDRPILNFGVSWRGDPDQFEGIVENVLEKRLLALEGVANVQIGGLKKKSIYIDLDSELMRAARVNAFQLANRIRGDNNNLPAGNVRTGGKKYNLRVVGQFSSVDEIGELPINSRGLRLEQVADVRFDYPKKIRWFQRLNGNDAVSISIFKASNANIIDVNRRVRATLESIKADPRYTNLNYQIFWDQSEEILTSINNLEKNGIIGGILAVAVLFFFLGNLRNTVVIAFAIPISIVCTIFFMYLSRLDPFNSDLTLNVISMMGMIYAIGIVIDPSIVVLENIFRIRKEKSLGAVASALEGSREVGLAVLASILTNIIVFAPLIFLGGHGMMRFMSDFGITFCVISLASLFVAVTVVPLLTARIIHNLQPSKERNFPRLNNFFTFLVSRALHYRAITLLIVAGILWSVVYLYRMIDKEAEPFQHERRMYINVEISHNYSMDQASKFIRDIESKLLERKKELEIISTNVSLSMGRRNHGDIQVYFEDLKKGGLTTAELENEVKKLLPVVPGFNYRYNENWHHGGGGNGLEIVFKGERMDLLQSYARRTQQIMKDLPGVENVDLSTEQGEEEVRVVVDRDRAASSGISASQVARMISSQLSSRPNSRFKAPNREINIMLGLAEEDRLDLQRLETMEIYSPGGQQRDLKNLASIETGRGPQAIERDDRLYYISVFLKTGQSGIYQLSQLVGEKMSQINLAPGYSWELGRSFRNMVEAESQSQFAIIFSLLLIYILLAALFESYIHPFTILLSVPFAMIGVALIFIFTKVNLGNVSYIGVLIVCGLVVNNGIILVDYINQLRARGIPRRQAIIEAAQKRLRPILMTASTTVLSLLPMTAPLLAPSIFGPAEGRSAMWGPVGLAILGGMTTSTFLTLVITPTLYSLLDDLAAGARLMFTRVFSPGNPTIRDQYGV
ncbi:MAG TPA: efflux RND transporter permease subunit [archaeon]|nr:efflux RND transporter permease subunit [archaeon]